MTNEVALKIEEMFGHMAKITLKPANALSETTMDGKLVYSMYNASIFFMPKGSRSNGYIIESVDDIVAFEITRKNNKENAYQNELYGRREEAEQQLAERLEKEHQAYKEREERRKKAYAQKMDEEEKEIQREIAEASTLCDYEAFENEVLTFYESTGEPYSESAVKTIFVPMLVKLVYKGIDDVSEYPKHYFDKKRNPRFCTILEKKTGLKLANTQKKNVELIDDYLSM